MSVYPTSKRTNAVRLNEFLEAAPTAEPVCGAIAAMTSIGDLANRAPRVLADRAVLSLGTHSVRWFDTPHMPHGWECGLMMESTTRTFLCGDLFTQGGKGEKPLVETDILEPSEHSARRWTTLRIPRIPVRSSDASPEEKPTTLACMHGSAWRGRRGETAVRARRAPERAGTPAGRIKEPSVDGA